MDSLTQSILSIYASPPLLPGRPNKFHLISHHPRCPISSSLFLYHSTLSQDSLEPLWKKKKRREIWTVIYAREENGPRLSLSSSYMTGRGPLFPIFCSYFYGVLLSFLGWRYGRLCWAGDDPCWAEKKAQYVVVNMHLQKNVMLLVLTECISYFCITMFLLFKSVVLAICIGKKASLYAARMQNVFVASLLT